MKVRLRLGKKGARRGMFQTWRGLSPEGIEVDEKRDEEGWVHVTIRFKALGFGRLWRWPS